MKRLPRYKLCFVCGRDNQAGLDIQFFRSENGVFCEWTPQEKHRGYADRIHGGIVASVLDEAMGWAPSGTSRRLYYSAEISVRYRRPVPTGRALRVEGEVVEDRGRLVKARGRVSDSTGAVYATATGTYVPISSADSEAVLAYLYLEGQEERPITPADL